MLEPFVQRLIEIQDAEGLSGAAFAAKLGIDSSTWSLVRRGQRSAGRRVVDGAIRAYPKLGNLFAQSLTIRHEERNESK